MTSQSPDKPPETLRYRIQEIKLQPALSKYPMSLKILADNQVVHLAPTIAKGLPLQWNNIPPCDVQLISRIEIRAYEHHTFGRKLRVGLMEYGVTEIGVSLELSRDCNTTGLSMSVIHPTPQSDGEVAAKVLSNAKAMERQKGLLEKLGPVRSVITAVLGFGDVIAEADPRAKAVFTIFTKAWDVVEKQEKCDASVETLIDGLFKILPSLEAVKQAARLPQLQDTIKSLWELIEDASGFVIKYKSTGEAVRTLRTLIGSNAQEQVDNMLSKLGDLKEAFDRGIRIQTFQTIDDNVRRTLLEKLSPVGSARYDPFRACLAGTRETVIQEVLDWCKQTPAPSDQDSEARLMWVHGQAGLGKSAIATSICQKLDETNLLAASFFCKRDDLERRSPQRMLSTIIFGLAIRHPAYANALRDVLDKDPLLSSSAMQMQFDKLVQGVLGLPDATASESKHVVVVDAMDECGPEVDRRQLLGILLRISQLVPWLKIIITSRPDFDIRQFFGRSVSGTFATINIHDSDASSDIYAFIKNSIAQSDRASELPPESTELLTEKASGLFIWARTACEFVLNDLDPPEALSCILDSTKSGQPSEALDELYKLAVEASVKKGGRADYATEAVKQCLGAIIVCSTRKPLSVAALSKLFGEQIKQNVLQSVVDGLSAVLYIDHDQDDAVRVYHLSFADYVLDSTRSGEFSVNLQDQNTLLASRCLDVMMNELRFNICRLETSYKRNQEVTNMKLRIKKAIGRHLEYSCTYWASHAMESQKEQTTPAYLTLMKKLLSGSFAVYWVEVMSLLEQFDVALSILQTMQRHCKGQNSTVTELLREFIRFMQAFSQPIRESIPHIYISALALMPSKTLIRGIKEQQFPNTIDITVGRKNEWARWTQLMVHDGVVFSVAFSSDSRRIVSGSDDNTIRVWDTDTGAPVGDPLVGHSGSVSSVSFSSDSCRIVSGSDDSTIRVWDAETGAPAGDPLVGHSGWVSSVSFSSDSCRIVSGSYDKTIRVWDAETGAPAGNPLVGHSGWVSSVSFSSDSCRIVSGSYDKTIRVWDTDTGAPVGDSLVGHSGSVFSVAFSSDSRRIVSGSYDNTIRVWDAEIGAPVGDPLVGHSSWVRSVAFSSDSRRIVSGSDDKTIRVWDTETGAPVGNPLAGHSGSVWSVAFSSDSRRIVSGSDDNTTRVWDTDTGAPVGDPLVGHSGSVLSVAFSSDSRRIVSGSYDKTIRVWDAETGAPVGDPLVGHSGSVSSVAFSSDSRRIVSGSYDNTIRVWSNYNITSTEDPLVEDLKAQSELLSLLTVLPISCDQPVSPGEPENAAQASLSCSHQNVSRFMKHCSADGWVSTPSGELLFWLPPEYRRPELDDSLFVISAEPVPQPVWLDLSLFNHGTNWTKVSEPATETAAM